MSLPPIGFIGLGEMGGRMALNLVRAGYPVIAYDVAAEKIAPLIDAGASAGDSTPAVVSRCKVVMTSLPSFERAITIAREQILPHVKPDQIVIELSTMTSRDAQQLAREFGAKGVHYLDVPVSGWITGAASGTLRMFAGGDEAVFEQCKPILDVLGDPARVVYCGTSGSGQLVKMVNQTASGLVMAACIEWVAAISLHTDVSLDDLDRALGGGGGFRHALSEIIDACQQDTVQQVSVRFGQLVDYLADANSYGMKTPLTQALYDFMKDGDPVKVEDGRSIPVLWDMLGDA